MTIESRDYRTLLSKFASGEKAADDLPLDDQALWRFLFETAAHSGRISRTTRLATAAERLLHRPMSKAPAGKRQSAAIDALASKDRGNRRQAIRFLHEIEPDKDVLDAVSGVIHDTDPEVRIEAVRLLAQHPSKQTLPPLLNALETTFDLRETLAAEAIEAIGVDALADLTAMLENRDSRIRWRATRCMTKIAAEAGTKALPGLLKAFHDESPNVSWLAADGLLAIGPDANIPVLRSVLAERLTGVTMRALHHYAEHASPARVLRPVATATSGSGVGSATLSAVDKVLEQLES